MYRFLFAIALMLGMPCIGTATDTGDSGNDLDKRVMRLSEELRCLVCQNQTVAESNAELAVDLRNQIREQLSGGMAERDVLDFMVERYGDFVLYKPPVKNTTWILWFSPFLLLVAASAALFRKLWKQRQTAEAGTITLTEAQRMRADALLHEDRTKGGL